MNHTLLALALAQTGTPSTVDAPVVSATIYKSGVARVVRNINIPKAGEWSLESIPQATNASLWFQANGLSIDSVTVANTTVKSKALVGSLEGLIRANMGKPLKATIYRQNKEELVDFIPLNLLPGANLVICRIDGQEVAMQLSRIIDLQAPSLIVSMDSPNTVRTFKIKTLGGAGTIKMSSIESGLSWAPAYAFNLENGEFQISVRATIVNNLADLNNAEVNIAFGGVTFYHTGVLEPLISAAVQAIGRPILGQMNQMAGNAQGFGGGGFAVADAAPAPVGLGELGGASLEDTYVLKLPKITLPSGGTQYISLYDFKTPYSEIFKWKDELGSDNPQDYFRSELSDKARRYNEVSHIYRFVNSTEKPMTTGPLTMYKMGEVIGQQNLDYIPAGAVAEISANQALDVKLKQFTEELTRAQTSIKRVNDTNYFYTRVTAQLTLQVENQRNKPITMELSKDLLGEVSEPDGAKITKVFRNYGDVNPISRAKWEIQLKPGEKRELKLKYSFLGAF